MTGDYSWNSAKLQIDQLILKQQLAKKMMANSELMKVKVWVNTHKKNLSVSDWQNSVQQELQYCSAKKY